MSRNARERERENSIAGVPRAWTSSGASADTAASRRRRLLSTDSARRRRADTTAKHNSTITYANVNVSVTYSKRTGRETGIALVEVLDAVVDWRARLVACIGAKAITKILLKSAAYDEDDEDDEQTNENELITADDDDALRRFAIARRSAMPNIVRMRTISTTNDDDDDDNRGPFVSFLLGVRRVFRRTRRCNRFVRTIELIVRYFKK